MTSGKQGSLKYSGGDLISQRASKNCWTFKEGEGFDGASVKRTSGAVHFLYWICVCCRRCCRMSVFCFLTLGQLWLGGRVGNNSWIWDKHRGKEKEEEEVVKEERI